MIAPYDCPLRPYGELWIGSKHGTWTEKYHVHANWGEHHRDAWENIKSERIKILSVGMTILGERGPFDEKWVGLDPEGVPSVSRY